MVHLGPLPGSPQFGHDLKAVIASALADAERLEAAQFDGVMIENFGDIPFFADDVPKATIAGMTRVVSAISRHVDIPFGVNVLRNDALGALAIAAATGASFIRVNVLSGLMHTDQGPIVGRAAEVLGRGGENGHKQLSGQARSRQDGIDIRDFRCRVCGGRDRIDRGWPRGRTVPVPRGRCGVHCLERAQGAGRPKVETIPVRPLTGPSSGSA